MADENTSKKTSQDYPKTTSPDLEQPVYNSKQTAVLNDSHYVPQNAYNRQKGDPDYMGNHPDERPLHNNMALIVAIIVAVLLLVLIILIGVVSCQVIGGIQTLIANSGSNGTTAVTQTTNALFTGYGI